MRGDWKDRMFREKEMVLIRKTGVITPCPCRDPAAVTGLHLGDESTCRSTGESSKTYQRHACILRERMFTCKLFLPLHECTWYLLTGAFHRAVVAMHEAPGYC